MALHPITPTTTPTATRIWRVMKFGGTSVGGPIQLLGVRDLVTEALAKGPVLVVASALSGVTNVLVDASRRASRGETSDLPERFRSLHVEVVDALGKELEDPPGVLRELDLLVGELDQLLRGISLLREESPTVAAQLSSLGERASCAILRGLLHRVDPGFVFLDPRRVLRCEGNPLEADPVPAVIRQELSDLRNGSARLALLPGFFGGDASGRILSLGRGGSDYSAALAAAALDAAVLEIWTDVDGIYSADPRLVPEATCMEHLTYEEAMELAHFGAKVLHPKTLAPARAGGIPVVVKNSFNVEAPGTWVLRDVPGSQHGVRGLSHLPGVTLINLSGPGLKDLPGVSARVLDALARKGISVVLVSQASSECAISVGVREADTERALASIESSFLAEQATGMVDPLQVLRGHAVLTVVGEGMHHHIGIAGGLFGALADAGCNVVAIAQGSSERAISTVISEADAPRAVAAAHHRFFASRERVELYLLGVGTVGSRVLALLQKQEAWFREQGLDVVLCGVTDARRMLLEPGISPGSAAERLAASGVPNSLLALANHVRERRALCPILLDCTTSEEVAEAYPDFVAAGLHVVAANKKFNSGPLPRYHGLRQSLARFGRRFRYETNVGAGLPVLTTLRAFHAGGDRVRRFEGILSGSLSFLMGRLEDGIPFSTAVREAMDKGFTEPDPRDDLSGLDVARKVMILHRECGGALELQDVRVEGLLPEGFDAGGDLSDFLKRIEALDQPFAALVAEAKAQGKVLRHVGAFEGNRCHVSLQSVAADHPLFPIRGGENAFSFLTEFYDPCPLVVRGYGAGAEVTASGVLADVARVARGGTR